MIKAIPRRMLPNQVIYKEYIADTGEGSSYKNGVYLKHVKVEEREQLKKTTNGLEVVGNAVLFYDLVNSEGLKDEPVQHSKIIFNDKEYHIVDIEILRADKATAHHYEMLLK